MNKIHRPVWGAAVVVMVLCVVWAGASLALMLSTLEAEQRAGVINTLLSSSPLAVVLLLPVGLAVVKLGTPFYERWVLVPMRLAEAAKGLLAKDGARLPPFSHSPTSEKLTEVLHALADQRDALRAEVATEVARSSARIEQERSRLAALMSELTQSVVVCNLDGRVILYNRRARMQFKALSVNPSLAHGIELLGIGRSIYSVFDPRLVNHALEHIRHRMAKGASGPTAQFVTPTRAGQLLRVQVAPVSEGDVGSLSGFVLMLDNITRHFEEETQRDARVSHLMQVSRALALEVKGYFEHAAVQAPTAEAGQALHAHALQVHGDLSQYVADTGASAPSRWPLEDMRAADMLDVAVHHIGQTAHMKVVLGEVDGNAWLRLDSYSFMQVLGCLSQRLADEYNIGSVQLRVQAKDGVAWLDLVWGGTVMSTETAMTWELDALRVAGEELPFSVRDIVNRHSGQMWFERDRARHEMFFRFQLPLAVGQETAEAAPQVLAGGRPEYYDFDLFQVSEQSRQLDDRLLSELVYTVFDTETTGLNPSQGDEIIQIGAVRVVNQRLLVQESMDQLIDPKRNIPAHTIPIHGITPEMVRGKPTIEQALPTFHAFSHDTVLVAHNAAFDMKFLELKQRTTGLVFDQPVLDTLLLSAVVYPQQESHRLEALAERFHLVNQGRHTALGDAVVTAEVFLCLIPLLAQQGIHTLRQAREASERTHFARIKY